MTRLNVTDYWKKLTIKNAINISSRAWATVSTRSIANCWNKAMATAVPHAQATVEIKITEQPIGDHLDETPYRTGPTAGRQQKNPSPQPKC